MSNPASLLAPAPWRSAARLVPLIFALALGVHLLVLRGFPNSADEYVYLWQATAFAEGSVTAAIPQPREAFAFFHLGDLDGVRFSRFPPGWPLLLTPGILAGLPGLVNPLLAALALAGIYRLGCAWVGPRAAALGTLLTALSPFFLLNAASFHSHPASLFALTALALALEVGIERRSALPFLLAGAAFGLAVLIRPYTALLLGLPLLGSATWRLHRGGAGPRPLLYLVLGGLPFAVVFGLINHAVTGSWTTLATTRLDPEEGLGFGIHGHTLTRGLQHTLLWQIEALAYTFFLSPLLLAGARGRAGARAPLLWLLLAMPVIGYLFYWNPGGNRYGPRFYFEALLPFTLLTGVGLEHLLERGRYRRLLAAAGLMGLAILGKLSLETRAQIEARRDVYRTVEAAGLERAVVLLLSGSADMHVFDLTRNPPDHRRAPVLFGRGRGEDDLEVARHHPDRRLYYYRWQEGGGKLWPLEPSRLEPAAPIPDR